MRIAPAYIYRAERLQSDLMQVRPAMPTADETIRLARLTVCDGLLNLDDTKTILEMLGLD